MTPHIHADYSHHRTMEQHFGILVEEVYIDSKLVAILSEDNNSFATNNSYTIDADDVCE
jgi:hypothetical protein